SGVGGDEVKGSLQDLIAELAGTAALLISAAGRTAIERSKERAYRRARREQLVRLRKMWIGAVAGGGCETCAMLDGTVERLGRSFKTAVAKPSIGPLGPPLHLDCECHLVPHDGSRYGLV